MFCPNCGTQNDSTATPCKKCGFKLSSVSVPKFKGTMMLNSDQTVQELIEEHRRRQAQAVPAEKSSKGRPSDPAPKRAASSNPPPAPLSGAKGPVFQPPRAASRGRMGGTIMGVAPQSGGILPPNAGQSRRVPGAVGAGGGFARPMGDAAPAEPGPPARPSEPPRSTPVVAVSRSVDAARPAADVLPAATADVLPAAPADVPSAPPAELARPEDAGIPAVEPSAALAGTVAVPISEAPAADPAVALDRPRPAKTVPLAASSDIAAGNPGDELGRTPSAAPAPAEHAPIEHVTLDPVPVDELRSADTQPPRQRPIPATAAIPQRASAASAPPPRIDAIDVLLIICTLGLYGIVLLFKLRKRPA